MNTMSYSIDYEPYFYEGQTLYVHGKTNTGKTSSIMAFVKENHYDYTYTSIQQLKNEGDFHGLLECQNVYKMFFSQPNPSKKKKKIIIIDNIDHLQTNDKKMLNIMIKFFKHDIQKYKHAFFVLMGTNRLDKKVIELMDIFAHVHEATSHGSVDYDKVIKDIVKDYLTTSNHKVRGMNDKNIISLCYHENIIYSLPHDSEFYETFLRHFCEGDYYDRLSFQKQLWQFNEMTFFLKVIMNYLLCQTKEEEKQEVQSIDFTKILTKFSNEYSNLNFIIGMCEKAHCQKEELHRGFKMSQPIMYCFSPQERKRITKILL